MYGKENSNEMLNKKSHSREVVGVATTTNIISLMVNKKVRSNDPVEKAILRHFVKVSPQSMLGRVYRILEKSPFLLVIEDYPECKYYIYRKTLFF